MCILNFFSLLSNTGTQDVTSLSTNSLQIVALFVIILGEYINNINYIYICLQYLSSIMKWMY